MSHLDAGVLHGLLDGEIPSGELGPIQEHLAACAECRTRLEEERQLLAESDSLVGVVEVPAGERGRVTRTVPASRQRLARSLAWAATIVVAAGLGYAARGVDQPSLKEEIAATLPAAGLDTLAPAAPSIAESAGFRKAAAGSSAPEGAAASGESGRRARGNVVSELAQERKSVSRAADAAPPAATPPPQNAPAATPAESLPSAKAMASTPAPSPSAAANVLGAQRTLGRLRDEPARVDQLQAAAEAGLARPEPITFPDAVRRLAGSLRMIEGLYPLRLEALGLTVRVVYSTTQGELVLSQQLVDGRVEYRLLAPPGFPADSLARLKARVRE